MPRVTPLTETQIMKERLQKNLKLMQGSGFYTDMHMGEIMGISAATYNRRKKNPLELSVSEITLLCKKYRIPVETFMTQELKIGG